MWVHCVMLDTLNTSRRSGSNARQASGMPSVNVIVQVPGATHENLQD